MAVLFAAALVLMSLLGTASAAPDAAAEPFVTIPAPDQGDVSALALSCGSGNLCVWPVGDGSSSRCSWSGADPDWQGGSIRCSWSGSREVRAVYNHGTSSSYTGVCLYPAANYGGNVAYYFPQGQQVTNWPNVKIRSHKWVTNGWCF